jgi:hypothetical protein
MSLVLNRVAVNDWDNYTNWADPFVAPMDYDVYKFWNNLIYFRSTTSHFGLFPRDPVIDGAIIVRW